MLSLKMSLLLITLFFGLTYMGNLIYLKYYNKYSKSNLKKNFMGTILIIFGLLKLYDISKFSQIFRKYDIISKNIPLYSYIYPFLEIALGISYLKKYNLNVTNNITGLLMIISIISVLTSIISGQKLRCGCMGSFFHIPLSYVTLSENILMLYMIL